MSVDQTEIRAHSPLWLKALVFSALFLVVVVLQNLSGAYQAEFGGYPDEPAHYVTSVMVRDYLAGGKFSAPMQFASNYYKAYPKVAFGHWPPLLYAVQGVWMLVFSESRASVLIELALTTTIAAFLLFLIAARHFGTGAGVLSSFLLVCLPIVQAYSDEEMAESLLLLTGFAAVIYFYRYLETKRWHHSMWFGIFCSLAILTKGNGWALALVPPIAIVLTRNFAVLKKPSLWIPLPIVAVLCLPWQILTLEMAHRGWVGGEGPNLKYTIDSLWQFAVLLCGLPGWAIAALAIWGIWLRVIRPASFGRVKPFDAVMFALLISIWVFHAVVPAGVEPRKMVNALPAVILFALAGGQWIAKRISLVRALKLTPAWSSPLLAGFVALLFTVQTFAIPREQHYGFTEAGRYIEQRPDLNNAVILVSSERDGEGLLISELMMQDARPDHLILRANKMLSVSDWNGNVAKEFCHTPGDIMEFLKRENVRAVVMDTYPPRVHYRHNDLILQAIRDYPASFNLASTFGAGMVQIYDVKAN